MNMYPHWNDQEFIYEKLLLVVFVGLGPQMPGILLRPPCAEAASLQARTSTRITVASFWFV